MVTMDLKQLSKYSIMTCHRGSQAHGTATATSDTDVLMVSVLPESYYHGLHTFDAQEFKDSIAGEEIADIIVYDIKKFFRMVVKQNPNIMEVLFMDPKTFVNLRTAGKLVLANRDHLLSKQAYFGYKGYASQQLQRLGVCDSKAGAARKAMFEEFGFIPKQASHAIRLLRQGIELLNTGEIVVDRTGLDAEQLIAIKEGKVPLAEIQRMGETLLTDLDAAFEKSSLPHEIDFETVSSLCVEVIKMAYKRRLYAELYK